MITDEMVEKASQRFLSNVSPSEMRAALEAVAPLIAKAEAEELPPPSAPATLPQRLPHRRRKALNHERAS